jgi:hypothetical protein
MPARKTPPTTTLRRAYFQDMKSPVHVDTTRARAVAQKNTFVSRGLGGGDSGDGARGFGASDLGASGFALAGGAALRGGR